MANNHGGARLGAGRKPRAETHRLPIARAEKRIADRLPELIDNLFILAMGGYERVEEQWVPAGTVESGGVCLFPNLPPEQLVLVVRKSSRADRDRAANIYLIDRILGKPVMAIDAEVSGPGGGPVPIAFAEAVRKIYGEPGDGDSG